MQILIRVSILVSKHLFPWFLSLSMDQKLVNFLLIVRSNKLPFFRFGGEHFDFHQLIKRFNSQIIKPVSISSFIFLCNNLRKLVKKMGDNEGHGEVKEPFNCCINASKSCQHIIKRINVRVFPDFFKIECYRNLNFSFLLVTCACGWFENHCWGVHGGYFDEFINNFIIYQPHISQSLLRSLQLHCRSLVDVRINLQICSTIKNYLRSNIIFKSFC